MRTSYIRLVIVAALIYSLTAVVYAGGSSESGAQSAAEAGSSTEEAAEGSPAATDSSNAASNGNGENPNPADALDALRSIGIQVFSDEIQARDFTLQNLDGEERSLSSFEGKVVFLNFWATWCGPCVQEMPSMQTLHDELSGDGLEIVAVNLQEGPDTVQAFVDRFGYTYPILLDRRGEVGMTYSVRGIPSTFIVAPDGRLLGMKVGYRLWDEPEVIDAFRTVLQAL
jgi:thiol-disulfide isomerase/thioredoxin